MQRGHPREVGRQRRHDQLDLHPARPRHVVVVIEDPLLERGHGVGYLLAVGGELLLEAPHERRVFLEDPPVLGRQGGGHRGEVFVDLVEHALQALAVAALAIELVEHLVGIVDRRHRLVGPGIDHPGPGVGAVGHEHTVFERAEPRGRLGPALEKATDLLVDRTAARPACRGLAASLDVAREELDPGQQAADAPHVAVAVTPDLVVDALEREQPVLEGRERLEDRRQLAVGERALALGPEVLLHSAVGGEHDHQPLLRPGGRGGEARQVAEEGEHGRADSEPLEQPAAGEAGGRKGDILLFHRSTRAGLMAGAGGRGAD